MKPTFTSTFSLLGFVQFFIPPSSGKPLQTASPGPVYAIHGKDATLPCDLATSVDPLRVMVREWSRVDGPSPLTVHVVRNGVELVKEKAPQYIGRTDVMEDGSLKLLGVQQWDNGTYRCVLLRGSSVEGEAFVSLIVAQVSQVNLSVWRTSANELFVHCESSGWSPEPLVSLLDSRRNNIPATRWESPIQLDGFYSVRALVNVAEAEAALTGNGTLICRVEIPGMDLANENKISITDEFVPSQIGHGCYFMLFFIIAEFCVVVVIVVVVVFVVPVWRIEKLRSSLTGFCPRITAKRDGQQRDQPLIGDDQRYTEYGDIRKVETSGASEDTARANQLLSRAIQASHDLAARDLQEMLKYKDIIVSVGETLSVHPALIAAIISRQSQAGTKLSTDGYGKFDPNSFGLMQINKHYHAVKGNPFSREHVDQGVTFFIQLIKTMKRMKPQWTKEQQLKGALACYIAGEEKVIPLTYEEVDSKTPRGDFANDVVARAQWFADNGF